MVHNISSLSKRTGAGTVPMSQILADVERSYVADILRDFLQKRLTSSLRPPTVDIYHSSNLVHEGVAGVGKTYGIHTTCREIATTRPGMLENVISQAISSSEKQIAALVSDVCAAKFSADDVSRALLDIHEQARGNADTLLVRSVVCTLCVLHPSTSYEEMIVGLRPSTLLNGGVQTFTWTLGGIAIAILKAQIAFREHAKKHDDGKTLAPHVLVLDEINRCNLPSVLGELMLVIDPSRRMTVDRYKGEFQLFANDQAVADCQSRGLAAHIPHLSDALGPTRGLAKDLIASSLWIPENLYILGTMNSSDRSILGFDQALRRRFPPKRIEPYTLEQWHKELVALPSTPDPRCLGLLATEIVAWSALNAALRARIGPDAMVGHSYLFTCIAQLRTASPNVELLADTLARIWHFDVLPQVIHAAESAREEKFAQQLFEDSPSKGADWKGKETSLRESLAAVGVNAAHKDAFMNDLITHGVGSFSLARRHRIVNIGDRHGQRLLIEKRALTTHAYGCDLSSFRKASDYASLNPENQQAIIKACRLVDRQDNGALTAKFPPPTTNPTTNPKS